MFAIFPQVLLFMKMGHARMESWCTSAQSGRLHHVVWMLPPSQTLSCSQVWGVPPCPSCISSMVAGCLSPHAFSGSLTLCYCPACLGTPACEGLGLLLRRGTVVSGSPSWLALSAGGLFLGHSWKGALPIRL